MQSDKTQNRGKSIVEILQNRAIAVTFGDNLRKLRKDRGVSQAAVAVASGLGQPMICGIENGDRLPSLEAAVKISQFLGVQLDDMVTPPVVPPVVELDTVAEPVVQ